MNIIHIQEKGEEEEEEKRMQMKCCCPTTSNHGTCLAISESTLYSFCVCVNLSSNYHGTLYT